MMKLSTSLQMYTDLCLFYSAVQCTVLPARSYREMDMYFLTGCEDAVEGACCCSGFLSLTMLFGLLRHNPLCWRFSDVLVHFSFFFLFFWQSYTISLKKKKIVWFHNDLCCHNEKEKETQQSRGGICVRTSYQTQ